MIYGINGFLIEKGNSFEMYRRMKQLADHGDLRMAFGEESRKVAEERFHEEKVLQRLRKIYSR